MSVEVLRKGSKVKPSAEVLRKGSKVKPSAGESKNIDEETKAKVEELEKAINLIASTKLIEDEEEE